MSQKVAYNISNTLADVEGEAGGWEQPLADETSARESADTELQDQIDAITNQTSINKRGKVCGSTTSGIGGDGSQTWNNWIYFAIPVETTANTAEVSNLMISCSCGSRLMYEDSNNELKEVTSLRVVRNGVLADGVEEINNYLGNGMLLVRINFTHPLKKKTQTPETTEVHPVEDLTLTLVDYTIQAALTSTRTTKKDPEEDSWLTLS